MEMSVCVLKRLYTITTARHVVIVVDFSKGKCASMKPKGVCVFLCVWW